MSLMMFVLLLGADVDAGIWRKPDGDPEYEGFRTLAQELVDEGEARARTNHICFVVERVVAEAGTPPGEPADQGWLYWREGRWLFSVGRTDHPPLNGLQVSGGGSIDLAHDVIASERDRVAAYDRRMTRAFVQRITDACTVRGTSLVVQRTVAG